MLAFLRRLVAGIAGILAIPAVFVVRSIGLLAGAIAPPVPTRPPRAPGTSAAPAPRSGAPMDPAPVTRPSTWGASVFLYARRATAGEPLPETDDLPTGVATWLRCLAPRELATLARVMPGRIEAHVAGAAPIDGVRPFATPERAAALARARAMRARQRRARAAPEEPRRIGTPRALG